MAKLEYVHGVDNYVNREKMKKETAAILAFLKVLRAINRCTFGLLDRVFVNTNRLNRLCNWYLSVRFKKG